MGTRIENKLVFGGGTFPLIFNDGKIKNIPMNKVHIDVKGISSLPSDCYPILMKVVLDIKSGGNWAACSVRWGKGSPTNDDMNKLVQGYFQENNIAGESIAHYAYVPLSCVDYEDLINGKLFNKGNRPMSNDGSLYYVWAEK